MKKNTSNQMSSTATTTPDTLNESNGTSRREFLKNASAAAVSLGVGLGMSKRVFATTSNSDVQGDFMALHKDLICIDGCVPLLLDTKDPKYFDWFKEGGFTAIVVTIAAGDMRAKSDPEKKNQVLDLIGFFQRQIHTRDDLLLVRKADDVLQAKKQGKLGIILHHQGAVSIEYNLDLVDMYKSAGVGVTQLTYNEQNQFGSGILVPTDTGLTKLGVELIKRLNEAKVIVDVAHTGLKTSLDAVKNSSAPVIVSHSNARGALNNLRNAPDEVIKAVADSGGFTGAVMFPPFVVKKGNPTMEDFLRHIDYLVNLGGIDGVSIGADYFGGQSGIMSDEQAMAAYDYMIESGAWSEAAYTAPPYVYPEGVEVPKTFYNLTGALLKHGYSEEDIRKIMGGNWMRVMKEVWG